LHEPGTEFLSCLACPRKLKKKLFYVS
jgi:hypothetical protein